MNAIAMAVGGAIMLALTAVFDEAYVVPRFTSTLAAQAYLVLLGSVVVFALYLSVLRRWTASAVSYEGVLIPLVAVVLSAWLQDERITWAFVAGSGLVYYGALRRRPIR